VYLTLHETTDIHEQLKCTACGAVQRKGEEKEEKRETQERKRALIIALRQA